ncbi:NB-ARC domain-containing protein [Nostoc sp. WHI]|uniref:WD40 domain-containing protein n=1 Tax=Nostoc sp. WHI TaxID=2650611 RepID=UPI0018C78894|nr:NB-ARC domain-containing protein [Nostoc sp. WHI]MBG1265090.1 NACHT domain-containing protein [Nostoc sp. WHI]
MNFEEAVKVADTVVFAKTKRHLKDIEIVILRASWQGQQYYDISETYGYAAGYLKYDVGPKLWKLLSEALGEKVSKKNFQGALQRRWRNSFETATPEVQALETLTQWKTHEEFLEPILPYSGKEIEETTAPAEGIADQRQDWGEAVDVSVFYGRTEELRTLEQWIVQERSRLVTILGIGGIGKTALSVRLAQEIQGEFEYVIWRSLLHAPSIEDVLAELIQFLSDQQQTNLPEKVDARVSLLIDCLRSSRCLVVLDNFESILDSGNYAGSYRQGYEEYGELLIRIGKAVHTSCLVLTSREKPKEVALLEGEAQLTHSLQINGLKEEEGQKILKAKGLLGTLDNSKKLIEYYLGNPLELNIVSTSIRELFDGNISDFLEQDTAITCGIYNLLEQQFNRLSHLEKQIMYWLAINQEQTSLQELQEDIIPPVTRTELLEAVESLKRRSLCERISAGFTQHPVIMEYMIQRFVELVYSEIVTEEISLLMSYALIKAQAKDYIREIQVRLILKQITDRLILVYDSQENIKYKLTKIISKIRERFSRSSGYATGNIINLFSYLQIDLAGYDFSHLTVWQAYLENVNLDYVNFAYSNLAKSTFAKTLGGILSMAFSPDGKFLATSDTLGEIHLWNVLNSQQFFICKGHTTWTYSVTFSPLGNLLASASQDQTVKLWDVSTGQCLKTLTGHISAVQSVAFSPLGNLLASASYDQTVKLWDVSTGQCLKTLTGHISTVQSVAFSPDNQTLASGSQDCTVKLWDVRDGNCINTLQGHTSWVSSVAFNPQGNILASGSDDHTAKLWNVSNGQCMKTLDEHVSWVSSVTFSPDGQILATGSDDHTVKLWNVSDYECLNTLRGHIDWVSSVTFSSDGQTLATGSHDQTVKLWNIYTGQDFLTLQGYTNRVLSITFNPKGNILATGNDDHTVKLWDISTGQCLKTLQGHIGRVWSVAFSSQGNILATGSDDHTVKLWDISTGQCLKTLQGHTNRVWLVTFNPLGNLLASGSDDHTAKLWNVSDGNCLNTLQGHTSWVSSVAFSPLGNLLASGSDDHTAKLWNVSDGNCLNTFQGHTSWVSSVAFSPLGNLLASGSHDQTVKLWDISTGKCLNTLQGHTNWVSSVAFSPDGQILASASHDQTVKLWDISTGKCLNTLQGHTSWVSSVKFCPLGKTVASSSLDETIKLWNLSTGSCLRTLRVLRLYNSMNITGVTGLTQGTIATLKAFGAVENLAVLNEANPIPGLTNLLINR